VVYAETTRLAQYETGTVYYSLGRDEEHRHVFHFFERYMGKKAFEAHNAQPIIQKLVNEDKYIRGVKARFVTPIRPTGQQG
jgi:quinol monooxygenase YgiN